MMEKLTAFTFEVKWVSGKSHRIADALSRAPVFPPDEEIDLQVDTALTCLLATSDQFQSDLWTEQTYIFVCSAHEEGWRGTHGLLRR